MEPNLTIHQALLQGAKLLEDSAIPSARPVAEILLCHALGQERVYLYAHPEEPLSENTWIHYGRYLHERLQGKPTQYILGRQEFYGREFLVTADVLIPRHETEHLVSAALWRIKAGDVVLDVGAGAGAIAVTVSLESTARVIGCDLSVPAVEVCARNARRLGAPVAWFAGDIAAAVGARTLDMIVSNPPYVPSILKPHIQREVRDWEPHLALFGGPAGLDFYRKLIDQAEAVLRPGGWLLMELGLNTLEHIKIMLGDRWDELEVSEDFAGFERVLAVRLKPQP